MEGNDPGGEERNGHACKLDINVLPSSKELCDPVMEFGAISSTFKENQDQDKGNIDTDLNKTPHQKPKRRKHRPKVIKEGQPKRTQKPVTPKPFQSKENPTVKRKYVRKNALTKISIPPTELTRELAKEMPMSCRRAINFDMGTRDESSAAIENTTALLGKGNGVNVGLADDLDTSVKQPSSGVVMQDTNVGFPYDLNTAIKWASNSYMSLPEETQATNTSSRKKRSGAKPKENPTAKRKYVRKKGVKTSAPPIEVPGELTREKMSATAQTSCTQSINFDGRAREKSYAVKENLPGHPGSEIGVVMQEMNACLAYDLNTSTKQTLNEDMTLPKEAQAPGPSSKINLQEAQAPGPSSTINLPGTKTKENLTSKRKNVTEKVLNLSPIPSEMTGLTEAFVHHSNNMSWRRSSNNLDLHNGKEILVLEETKVGRSYNQDTWINATLANCIPLPEGTQDPSTSISEYTHLGAKLNANSVGNKNKGQATTQDGNISNCQSSTIRSQMVGTKRKYSCSFSHADDSNMNLIGAHFNGLPSYQTGFCPQFPNIQKKRRTEKGKTSARNVTSVTATKELQQTYPQEDALGHPYASTSSCCIYGSGYNTTGVPVISEFTENFIDNTQTFDEFILSLKRMAERSQTSNCDSGSPTRIRNGATDTNYTTKQVGVSGRETFGDAKRPQTCLAALVAETPISVPKKKRNRKKKVLSSSAHSSTNGMLWHRNFALANYTMPVGKSSGLN